MIVGQDGESKKGRARRGEGEAAGGPPVEARVCQSNKTSTIHIETRKQRQRQIRKAGTHSSVVARSFGVRPKNDLRMNVAGAPFSLW